MFERVLFPTDFSEYARMAMNCLAGIPGLKEIILLHVIEPGNFNPVINRELQISQVREKLEAERSFLHHLGQNTVKTVIHTGQNISGCIVSTADKEDVSIIIMGTKNKGLFEGLHLGSTSYRVLHETSKNLLILRSNIIEELNERQYQKFCPNIFSKVLVSTDLSAESLKAVREIASLPGINELIVCYSLPRGITESEINKVRDEALKQLETTCREITSKDALIRVRILEGEPVEEIRRYAQESDVSLICSIPHGKGTIDEIIYGSFTCDLIARTNHPILIYHSQNTS